VSKKIRISNIQGEEGLLTGFGYFLHRKCFLKHVLEGKIGGWVEIKGR
jgi:hypothetical protein